MWIGISFKKVFGEKSADNLFENPLNVLRHVLFLLLRSLSLSFQKFDCNMSWITLNSTSLEFVEVLGYVDSYISENMAGFQPLFL